MVGPFLINAVLSVLLMVIALTPCASYAQDTERGTASAPSAEMQNTPLPGETPAVEEALAIADSVYALAVAAHEEGNYATSIPLAEEGLLALFDHAEPTDDAHLMADFRDDKALSGGLILHLYTQRTNLRLNPADIARVQRMDRETQFLFMTTGTPDDENTDEANRTSAVEAATVSLAEAKGVYGDKHLTYLNQLRGYALLYYTRDQVDEANKAMATWTEITEPLLGRQHRMTFLMQFWFAFYTNDGHEDLQKVLADAASFAQSHGLAVEHVFALRMQERLARDESSEVDSDREARRLTEDADTYRRDADAALAELGLSEYEFLQGLDPMMRFMIGDTVFGTLTDLLALHHTRGVILADDRPVDAAQEFREAADLVLPLRDLLQGIMTQQSSPIMDGMKAVSLRLFQGAAASGVLTLATAPDADPAIVEQAMNVVIQHKSRDFDRETKQKRALQADTRAITSRTYSGVRQQARDVAGLIYAAPALPGEDAPEEAVLEPEPAEKRGRFGRFRNRVAETAKGTVTAAKGGIRAAADYRSGELLASDSLLAAYMHDVQTLRNEQYMMQQQLQSYSSLPLTGKEPQVDDIAARLREGTRLVDIVQYYPYDFERLDELVDGDTTTFVALQEDAFAMPERYAAFVLNAQGQMRIVDLGPTSVIDTLVTGYRQEMEAINPRRWGRRQQEEDAQRLGEITQQIYAAVIAPLSLPETGTVYLSPDGLLRIIPFETLQDENGTYLLDRYAFTYLASARSLLDEDLQPAQDNAYTGGSLLASRLSARLVQPVETEERGGTRVFGGIEYGATTQDGSARSTGTTIDDDWLTQSVERTLWTPLLESATEVEFIQTQLGVEPDAVYTSNRATETELLRMRSPQRLHIATHGFFFESEISWMMDEAALAELSDAFLDRAFPNTRAHKTLDKDDDPTLVEGLLARNRFGRTALDVREKALTYENRVQQANAFLDDLDNLPKRVGEIKMDIVRWTDPLVRSGLVLAERNTVARERALFDGDRLEAFRGTDDGLATAYEIGWMDLRDTELVVLSACETGLGDIIVGEGVYGLGRSFQTAGAESVVMSLWQVDDRATSDLMTAFYANVDAGASHTEALRSAAQAVKEDRSHPFFWGPFILMGN